MRYVHGMSKSPEYLCWRNMRSRCENSNTRGFERYGGRGIAVCLRWAEFAAFLADVGPRPSPRHSIDRIDNDGNYEPGNVRWATRREQQQNMRSNVTIRSGGGVACVAEWSRRSGVAKNTILERIKAGKSADAILTPPNKRPPELRGVYFNKRTGKWTAALIVKRCPLWLGTFVSQADAIECVRRAKQEAAA